VSHIQELLDRLQALERDGYIWALSAVDIEVFGHPYHACISGAIDTDVTMITVNDAPYNSNNKHLTQKIRSLFIHGWGETLEAAIQDALLHLDTYQIGVI